jgi:hypothetical protein
MDVTGTTDCSAQSGVLRVMLDPRRGRGDDRHDESQSDGNSGVARSAIERVWPRVRLQAMTDESGEAWLGWDAWVSLPPCVPGRDA